MNITITNSPKQLLSSARKATLATHKYISILSFLIIFGLYGYLIIQISRASQKADSTTSTPVTTIKKLRIDQSSIDKLQSLEDQNISVKSLFESARNDPFTE